MEEVWCGFMASRICAVLEPGAAHMSIACMISYKASRISSLERDTATGWTIRTDNVMRLDIEQERGNHRDRFLSA